MAFATHSWRTWVGIKTTSLETPFGGYDLIGEAIDAKPINYSVTQTETSHLYSPQAHKEYIPGYVDAGEFTLSMNWEMLDFERARDLLATRSMFYIIVVLPNLVSYYSFGFFSALGLDTPFDDRIKADVTFKKTGVTLRGLPAQWQFLGNSPFDPSNPLSGPYPTVGSLSAPA